jgi:hypothetical protein
MPFQPIANPSDLPDNPLAKIFFTGQLIFEPSADAKTCEVFVNRAAVNHELLIEVRRKRPVGPDIILMRHQGRLNNAVSRHGMTIELQTGAAGVKKYTGPDGPPNRPDVLTFAHAFDLKVLYQTGSPPYNVPDLTVDPAVASPSLRLNHAIFYTAKTADSDLVYELDKGGVFVGERKEFTDIFGADIPRAGSSALVFTWRPNGTVEQLTLAPLAAADGSYEIYVINDPPFEPEPLPNVPPHDEFEDYFRALNRVSSPDRFNLKKKIAPLPPGASNERGSTRTPCMSVVIEGVG